MRSQAREAVFKFIFSQLFNPDDEGLFTVLCKELKQDDKDFANQLLSNVKQNEQEYLRVIEELAVGYKLNRLFATDKCALLIGIAELNEFPNTPVAVVIDQAVNLAGKFSTDNSTSFVNGLLGEYARSKKNG